MLMITNNPKVSQLVAEQKLCALQIVEGGIREVFVEARRLCQKGHKLLTHPLSGSVKPNHGLYKSILLSEECYDKPDMESIRLTEGAVHTLDKLFPVPIEARRKYDEDFMLVDFTLIMSALDVGVLSYL